MFKVSDRTFKKIDHLSAKQQIKVVFLYSYFYLERAMVGYIIHTPDYINWGPLKKTHGKFLLDSNS